MTELLSNASVVAGMIFIGLNLTMHHLLNKNGYSVGFFDINLRLMKKFKLMMDEEKDWDRKMYFQAIYKASVVSFYAIAIGICVSIFTLAW